VSEDLVTARLLIALRDAVLASVLWDDVPGELDKRGVTFEELRARLRPHIAFDPHCHTMHSDGLFSYEQILWWCRATGLAGVGVTDHDNLHPSIGDAIRSAESLGVRLVPGLEYTVHRLGGRAWRGLEVGLHCFPATRFGDFMRSAEGRAFCARFEALRLAKSEQAWGAMEAVNRKMAEPLGLPVIAHDELWEESGETDPVCASTLTVLLLRRIQEGARADLLERFPHTRAIFTHMQREGLVPPMNTPAQTYEDLAALRRELRSHGIRTTLTLNHPEEWLSKCGLVTPDGQPDRAAVLELMRLLVAEAPADAPARFIELYSPRNTPETRRFFESVLDEFEAWRAAECPDRPPLIPIASTDAHRISGSLGPDGAVRGWVPGEDFVFGLGAVDAAHPRGTLEVPDGYPGLDTLLQLMESSAS
jgi:hypothetical protein